MSTNLEKRLRGLKFMKKMVARTEIKEDKSFLTGLWKAATAGINVQIIM